jgi:hypothetical protein
VATTGPCTVADQARAGRTRAEYHTTPVAHLVFDEPTWADMKARYGARDDDSVAGQRGVNFDGTPVYIDECPWRCGQ